MIVEGRLKSCSNDRSKRKWAGQVPPAHSSRGAFVPLLQSLAHEISERVPRNTRQEIWQLLTVA